MIARALILAAAILVAGVVGRQATAHEAPIAREPLGTLPRTLGDWTGRADVALTPDVADVLRVDDYIDRTYVDAAGQPVNLYVGYYASQRQGEAIHSPQNCLPGAGWQPVENTRTTIDVAGARLPVNHYVIQKGLDRQVVLYWYQGRGRVVANDYVNKFWLIVDAARLHRSNGALVRVMAPVARSASGSLAVANAAAMNFTRVVFPHLTAYLP